MKIKNETNNALLLKEEARLLSELQSVTGNEREVIQQEIEEINEQIMKNKTNYFLFGKKIQEESRYYYFDKEFDDLKESIRRDIGDSDKRDVLLDRLEENKNSSISIYGKLKAFEKENKNLASDLENKRIFGYSHQIENSSSKLISDFHGTLLTRKQMDKPVPLKERETILQALVKESKAKLLEGTGLFGRHGWIAEKVSAIYNKFYTLSPASKEQKKTDQEIKVARTSAVKLLGIFKPEESHSNKAQQKKDMDVKDKAKSQHYRPF